MTTTVYEHSTYVNITAQHDNSNHT